MDRGGYGVPRGDRWAEEVEVVVLERSEERFDDDDARGLESSGLNT